MINKARKQFIMWATIAMAVIVAVLVAAVNIVNWYQNDYRLNAVIEEVHENGNLTFSPVNLNDDKTYRLESIQSERPGELSFPQERKSAVNQYGSRYFIATVNTDRTVVSMKQQQEIVSPEYAQSLVDAIEGNAADTGYISEYKYAVFKSDDKYTDICFLDCSTDIGAMNSLLLISCLVGIGGILIAFLFILRMSRIAVEPVRISIEKQKQFITNAGHELKTPLTSIATNMDILTMDLGENEWVDGTKKQVRRLRKLVENLVSLSKLEEDEQILSLQDFSISDMCSELIESFEPVAMMNGKQIDPQIREGLNIQGDPGTIQQLITILCDNAVKYSEGDGKIEIKLYDNGKNICFETVNDWKRNVDEGHLDDLFERFYRGDPARSTDNKSSGHGLGLSIARAIARKNNAKLTAAVDDENRLVFCAEFKKIG